MDNQKGHDVRLRISEDDFRTLQRLQELLGYKNLNEGLRTLIRLKGSQMVAELEAIASTTGEASKSTGGGAASRVSPEPPARSPKRGKSPAEQAFDSLLG